MAAVRKYLGSFCHGDSVRRVANFVSSNVYRSLPPEGAAATEADDDELSLAAAVILDSVAVAREYC